MKKSKLNSIVILLLVLVVSCTDEGIRNMQFYYYSDNKLNVEKDLLQVIQDYSDTIPQKWKKYTVPIKFIDDKFIYLKDPEEILRVGFVGDSIVWNSTNTSKLSLYGLFKGDKWIFGQNISLDEKERIKNRLETEILSKMRHSYKKEED